MPKTNATNIKPIKVRVAWDTDGQSLKSCGLKSVVEVPGDVLWDFIEDAEAEEYTLDPKTLAVTLDPEYMQECIMDWLSDEFGFCHFGWNVIA